MGKTIAPSHHFLSIGVPPDRPDPEREFWKLFKAGWSPKSLAKRFQITPARVREVLDGKARFPK